MGQIADAGERPTRRDPALVTPPAPAEAVGEAAEVGVVDAAGAVLAALEAAEDALLEFFSLSLPSPTTPRLRRSWSS